MFNGVWVWKRALYGVLGLDLADNMFLDTNNAIMMGYPGRRRMEGILYLYNVDY